MASSSNSSESSVICDNLYIPPMSDIDEDRDIEAESELGSISHCQTNKTQLNEHEEQISPPTPKSECSPSAVLFEIKDYILNEDGQIFNANDAINLVDPNTIGERLTQNLSIKKSVQRSHDMQDAEPDPVNYDGNHWKRFRRHGNAGKRNADHHLAVAESNIIGCRLRVFQCFSFLACLLAVIALLTDNLTSIVGENSSQHYTDSIVCGWKMVYLMKYDAQIGITQTTIYYADWTVDENLSHNLITRGTIWFVCSILAIVSVLATLIIFCCVVPMKPMSIKRHIRYYTMLLALTITLQIVAVIVWISHDYCADPQFIESLYDRSIQSMRIGTSIDVMIASALCSMVCVSMNVCVNLQR